MLGFVPMKMTRSAVMLLALLAAAPLAAATKAKEVLPFINDDYSKALSVAKTKNLPLFVEAWAPW